MTETARLRLRRLLDEFRSGTIDAGTFCSQFEHTYNMELDKRTLLAPEAEAFAVLFEEVIWYSPFPEEREKVSNYRGEDQIRRAADITAERLGGDPGN